MCRLSEPQMVLKKLHIEVDGDLHLKLKEEAKAKGLTLKAFCANILKSNFEQTDPNDYCLLPLDSLREIYVKLITDKPEDWVNLSRKVDNEIRRRFRT